MDSPIPVLSNSQNAPAYWHQDILWIVHATGEQTGGAYSLIFVLIASCLSVISNRYF